MPTKKEQLKLHTIQSKINTQLSTLKGELSDGFHTFNELYYHRMILFSVVLKYNKEKAWKSKLHYDGTMFENYFIVGINTEKGQFTYHYHIDNWDYFDITELPNAPKYDGHTPNDIDRLLSLNP